MVKYVIIINKFNNQIHVHLMNLIVCSNQIISCKYHFGIIYTIIHFISIQHFIMFIIIENILLWINNIFLFFMKSQIEKNKYGKEMRNLKKIL